MRLPSLLRRLLVRPPRGTPVELKPLEQAALAFLLRQGSATQGEIEAAVDARHPVLRPEPGEVLTALVQQGLAQPRIDIEASRTVYVATSRAQRLRRRLPEEPRTVMQFWV